MSAPRVAATITKGLLTAFITAVATAVTRCPAWISDALVGMVVATLIIIAGVYVRSGLARRHLAVFCRRADASHAQAEVIRATAAADTATAQLEAAICRRLETHLPNDPAALIELRRQLNRPATSDPPTAPPPATP